MKCVDCPDYKACRRQNDLRRKRHKALQTKVLAIENVAHMETHNCITKDDFVRALRWLFEHYEF